jgi:GT2 family glycosyltransferase
LLAHVREIVVVDNCSDDGTDEMVRNEFPDFVHLRTTENRGVAARNLGMRRASSSVVVTIDDDILGLTAGACAWIHEQFVANPSLGALNLQVNDWFTGRVCNWVHHRSVTDAVARFETYEITEGAVAFRRDMVVEAGGYFEEFFIAHEGPDLAYRLMNRGWEVLYDGHVTVLHKHEQQSRKPWRFYYYDTRNQVWLAARNMPAWAATRYLSRGLTAMAVYSIRDGFFQWWIKGVVDGIRGLPSIWRTRQVWTAHTRNLCAGIDSKRPPFWYLVRHRLFHRGNKLEA